MSIEKKTEDLADSSLRFKRESAAAKNRMWCKNAKWWIVLGCMGAAVVAVVVVMACHPDFKAC